MTAIESERFGGKKSKGGGGGGGGQNHPNNPASKSKNGPLHPAMYTSKKRMMEILRCNEAELELLKHGVAKIVREHPTVHYKQLRWELSEQEEEWQELLNGQRWEGEEYLESGQFDRDVGDVLIKLKGIEKSIITKRNKKNEKRNRKKGEADGDRTFNGDGVDGNGDEDGRGRSEGAEGGYMMSGALRDDTPGAVRLTPPPAAFRRPGWPDKDLGAGQQKFTSNTSRREGPDSLSETAEEDDLYGSTPPPNGRVQRMGEIRPEESPITPTPLAPQRQLHRMSEDEKNFVGVFDSHPGNRGSKVSSRTRDSSVVKGRKKTTFVDLCSDF